MGRLKHCITNVKALAAIKRKQTTLSYLPSYTWLEPTNRCNLRCVMCPNGAGMVEIDKGDMDFSFFKKFVDEHKGELSSITLAIAGESLLHPDFAAMVGYVKKAGIKALLNTNATLLDHRMSLALLDAKLDQVSFAFDGFTAEQYEAARRGANFRNTLDNIIHFLKMRKEMGTGRPYSVLSMLRLGLVEHSDAEQETFLSELDGLIDEVRMRDVASWGSTFKDTDDFEIRQHEGVYLPCSRLWNTTAIAWNGDVLPCIYDANHEYVLGNVHEQSFADIWNGERMVGLRQSMIDGTYKEKMPLCENCIVLGTPPVLGIPSGLRLTMADAAVNYFGFGFEDFALKLVNRIRGGNFSATRIR